MNTNEYKSYLTIQFDIANWDTFIEQYIPKKDIYRYKKRYGYEYDTHSTIIYGLHNDTKLNDIKKLITKSVSDIKVDFKSITIFENDEFDVVKFDIQNEYLIELNETIKNTLYYKNEYDVFFPHVTLAYVKKGMGAKYIKSMNESKTIIPMSY